MLLADADVDCRSMWEYTKHVLFTGLFHCPARRRAGPGGGRRASAPSAHGSPRGVATRDHIRGQRSSGPSPTSLPCSATHSSLTHFVGPRRLDNTRPRASLSATTRTGQGQAARGPRLTLRGRMAVDRPSAPSPPVPVTDPGQERFTDLGLSGVHRPRHGPGPASPRTSHPPTPAPDIPPDQPNHTRTICGTARSNAFGDVDWFVRATDNGDPGNTDEFVTQVSKSAVIRYTTEGDLSNT